MPPRKLTFLLSFLLVVVFACSAMAQNATVRVSVVPKQAYIFVDGKAIDDGHKTLELAPGRHTIAVHNYGYTPAIREVELVAGPNPALNIVLEKVGGPVSASFGVIQIEGPPRAAVLLNGTQPEYFVGHVDEFNNHIIWKQQLLVPAGTHEVSLLSKDGKFWSGKLEVKANKRVIIYYGDGSHPKIVVKDWPQGAAMTSVPRFTVGIASATVAVAPVTASFDITPKQINCSAPAKLSWNTTETLHTDIASDSGDFDGLPLAGDQTVSPRKTTTYQLKTSGPGGVIESSVTLNVNSTVEATLNGTPEVHYLRLGDTVLHQETATLSWTTTNADTIILEPIGKMNSDGSETLTLAPDKNVSGPVDETKSYKIVASNVCGGGETKETKVRLVGLVEPMISSVFFPTAYPERSHPQNGLLLSQQKQLDRVATVFKAYLQTMPNAKLMLTGMADIRGTNQYNLALSERRVAIVKEFLVAKGIPADSIVGEAKGENAKLDKAAVEELETQNPQQPVAGRAVNARSRWLAYNRRVDVVVDPAAVNSARFYPNQADDSQLLLESNRVTESKIKDASGVETTVASGQ